MHRTLTRIRLGEIRNNFVVMRPTFLIMDVRALRGNYTVSVLIVVIVRMCPSERGPIRDETPRVTRGRGFVHVQPN